MFRICIDPGHAAGSDKHGCHGFSEQAHNLLMAKSLKTKLDATGQFVVKLTRSDEKTDPALSDRGKMAAGYDVFLSMHTNGADGAARGVTVFHSVDIPTDKSPATSLGTAIAKALKTPFRGACTRASKKYYSKQDPSKLEDYYTVIDSAQDHGCKHVFLSESGFHDNPIDWAALSTPGGIDSIAEAHATVLCKLLGVSRVPAPLVREYTYKKGDSLWSLSRAFKVTITQIKRKDGKPLNALLMKLGDVLLIPLK